MLNQGFKEQIYDVYRYLPPQIQVPVVPQHCRISPLSSHQVLLISATLPREVLEMTQKFMTDPVRALGALGAARS